MNEHHPYGWLETGDEFFRALQAAIASARASLRLEMYIYTAGQPGDSVRAALVAAARRGVRVQVLLDAFGSMGLPDDYWADLAAAGGAFRSFNPLRLTRLVFRDHRKMLVGDACVAVVGGFNIMAEAEGDGVTRGWRDLGLRLEGPVVADLAAAFDTMWARAGHKPRRRWHLPKLSELRRTPCQPPVALLTSQPGHRSAIRRSLLSDFRQARNVRIISGYFLPSRPMRRALRRAARRGGDVQLITPGKTDVPLARYAGRALFARLLRARIRVFEYTAQVLHTKLMVTDDVVYIGSANLDYRSLHINFELLVRIADRRLAAEARRIFDGYLPHGRPIDRATWARARSLWEKIMERLTYLLFAHLDIYLARRGLSKLR